MASKDHSDCCSTSTDGPFTAACHCGRVRITIPRPALILNECRCTVCYKYGAIWGYFHRGDVKIEVAQDATVVPYLRYEPPECNGNLSFNRCSHCGCMTHWLIEKPFASDPDSDEMGVNCRMLTEKEIEGWPRNVSYC